MSSQVEPGVFKAAGQRLVGACGVFPVLRFLGDCIDFVLIMVSVSKP